MLFIEGSLIQIGSATSVVLMWNYILLVLKLKFGDEGANCGI
jgi:hypothetical protein